VKEDVLGDLPPKIIQDYYCDLSALQYSLCVDGVHFDIVSNDCRARYAAVGQSAGAASGGASVAAAQPHVFQALQYLRKVCNHPALVLTPTHANFAAFSSKLALAGTHLHDIVVR
jgi:TATA-binding protein-associated factor